MTKLIAVKDQEPLNITIPIIAYPEPYIFWTFDNNATSVNVTQKTSNSVINNRAFSSLYLENVTEKDFGHYYIYAGNGIGSTEDYIYSVEVIPKSKYLKNRNLYQDKKKQYITASMYNTYQKRSLIVSKVYVRSQDGYLSFCVSTFAFCWVS